VLAEENHAQLTYGYLIEVVHV
jgi:hypothetical protein